MHLQFDNRIVNQLPADPETSNSRRQVNNAVYSFVDPTPVAAPSVVAVSTDVASDLGLSEQDLASDEFLQVFSGNQKLEGMQPYAMCYGGHQFGHWAGQLGDGRAINLGEVLTANGEHLAIQLKGSGITPYSRTADGLAVLRSSVREFMCSEAMHHLGIPTTRALSLMTTGEQVLRDMMYNGNAAHEPGAIVCRVSPSFLRFGNFQIFASRKQNDELKQLADFTIEHHFSELLDDHAPGSKELYLAWFQKVAALTAQMIVGWMRVGFVHGVMNTDNMSILGLTIDYGPYGWLDSFDPEWTPNTTDAENRRYRYSQQPNIALWNLYQLANSLYPLIEDAKALEKTLEHFQADYQGLWLQMMADKLGFLNYTKGDEELFQRLETLLSTAETDMTLCYRLLSEQNVTHYEQLEDVYYNPENHSEEFKSTTQQWLEDYQSRLEADNRETSERFQAMQAVNPKYIFRNYLAQQAIDLADKGDYSMVQDLLDILQKPYQEQQGAENFAAKRPEWARTRVGCSMLSCSS